MLLCLVTLTKEHFQFKETAYKAVKVYGILSISVTIHNSSQHSTVDLEPWETKTFPSYLR